MARIIKEMPSRQYSGRPAGSKTKTKTSRPPKYISKCMWCGLKSPAYDVREHKCREWTQ